MKRLFLIFLFAMTVEAATASLPVTFTANTLAVTDLQTYLIAQVSSISGTVQTAMLSTDTSLTLASAPTGAPATGTVVIGTEIITYTGISGATLTGLARGTNITSAANNTVAAVHAAGSAVSFLTYANVTAWVKAVVLAAAQSAIASLGGSSTLVGTQLTAIQTNQATETTNLSTAIQ